MFGTAPFMINPGLSGFCFLLIRFSKLKNSGEKGVTQELLLMLTRGNALS
jgi:hypothetical protein